MVLRVSEKEIKLYLIPSASHSFAYFHEELPGRHNPEIKTINGEFGSQHYALLLKNIGDFVEPIYLELNPLGRLKSQHPIYYPKVKKFSSGQYCLSFILKDGDHQWLAIIKGHKKITERFICYEDDFGEEDI